MDLRIRELACRTTVERAAQSEVRYSVVRCTFLLTYREAASRAGAAVCGG